MELRHLRYFVAIAESLHFGQAAAKLRIAQPSLSHQIRQLEAELQTGLLRRTKRHVELTEAGRLLLEEARDILARTDRAAVMARRAGHGVAQPLRIGVGYCMDQSGIAAVVGRFNARRPDIEVELKTVPVPSQLAAVRDGRFDVGFVRPPINDRLDSEIVVREPLAVALSPTHRLASKARIPLAALANEPFILPPRDTVPVFHDAVLKICREAGFLPHVLHEADHLQMIVAMVAAGAGVGLVPAATRRLTQHRVVYRHPHPAPEKLEIAMVWRRGDVSPIVAEFVGEARRLLNRSANRRDRRP